MLLLPSVLIVRLVVLLFHIKYRLSVNRLFHPFVYDPKLIDDAGSLEVELAPFQSPLACAMVLEFSATVVDDDEIHMPLLSMKSWYIWFDEIDC